MPFTLKINMQALRWVAIITLLVVIVLSIAPKTINLFTKWANVDLAPHIDAGPTFPKDYEYEAALWIKRNTPHNTVIISDSVSIEILSSLADRVPLALISMGHPRRQEDRTRLEIIYRIFTAEKDSDTYYLLDMLKSMGVTTEQFYRSFRPIEGISFIILVSERTSFWLDVEMKYPIVYFNERPVNTKYISNFLGSNLFELLYQVEGKIYIFKPLADFFWNSADYSSDVVEKVEGCVLHIPFDDQDISIFETAYNVTKVEGKIGDAAYFGGVNSYIVREDTNAFDNNAITLEAWIKPEPEMPTEHIWNAVVAKGDPWKFMLFYNNAIKHLHMGIRIGGTVYYVSTPYIPDNNWHHLVGTYTDGDFRLYLDGQLKHRRTDVFGLLDTDDLPLTVGTMYHYISYPPQTRWKGSIDEVRIYNRVMSEQEILDHCELKFHKVARLGEIEIPFKVPYISEVEIKVLAAVSDNPSNVTAFKLLIYDQENIVYSKEIRASDFNAQNTYQLISAGITRPLNPDRNYIIQISSTSNIDTFIDYVTGRMVWQA